MNTSKNEKTGLPGAPSPFAQTYFHGTKADLKIGDFLTVGFTSNYENRKLKHIYVAATLHAAILAAELADGKENNERIYLVEATGPVEDDPNVTDKKFPGNPTLSYRSQHPFKVIGEVSRWQGHTMEEVTAFKQQLKKLKEDGKHVILD